MLRQSARRDVDLLAESQWAVRLPGRFCDQRGRKGVITLDHARRGGQAGSLGYGCGSQQAPLPTLNKRFGELLRRYRPRPAVDGPIDRLGWQTPAALCRVGIRAAARQSDSLTSLNNHAKIFGLALLRHRGMAC